MMLILDTDHFSALEKSLRFEVSLFRDKIDRVSNLTFITIITVDEAVGGWAARVKRERLVQDQVKWYQNYHGTVEHLKIWDIIGFDEDAATKFDELRKSGIRIGTMDLKIASIALVHDATLLTRNLKDFRKVPSLKIENWIDV